MRLSFEQICQALGVNTALPAPAREVTGWSIDTRTLKPGDCFIALKGQRHDGHEFVEEAFQKGAALAVVSRRTEASGPQIVVPDTLKALQQLGHFARKHWGGPVVGITGSAGKTTTKELIAAALSVQLKASKSIGNLNNHIGVPLSLLAIDNDSQVAVIELAMNHPGEIRFLAKLSQPQIGVVTNVGLAHAGFFKSVEEIALAKRELIEELPPEGIAVLNADDPLVREFAKIHPGQVITFGIETPASVKAENVVCTGSGVSFTVDGVKFESPLRGKHFVLNLLAAIAVARLFGVELEQLVEPFRKFQGVEMRGQWMEVAGVKILNDSYNANPVSCKAALETIKLVPARRRIAALGAMYELGDWSVSLHRELGEQAVEAGVDLIVGVHGDAYHVVEAAKDKGFPGEKAVFFETPEEAAGFLASILEPGDVVLVKGSRATRMEKLVELLKVQLNTKAEAAY